MDKNEQDEVIVDDVEDTNEEVEETSEEKAEVKTEAKPKRTPQEELEYFEGRAARLRKKLGTEAPGKIEPKEAPTGKPSELDFGQKAYLKSYGVSGSDELTLVKQFQDRGFALDTIVEDDVFISKLNSLREAKASADALPKSKPRSGATGVTDVDLAIAKYKENGELPKDFATRNKVVDAITKEESGDMFSGPSVIKG
jgi:hypothetical protein